MSKVKISNGVRELTLSMDEANMNLMKTKINECVEGNISHFNYHDPKSSFIFTSEYLKNSLIEFIHEVDNV